MNTTNSYTFTITNPKPSAPPLLIPNTNTVHNTENNNHHFLATTGHQIFIDAIAESSRCAIIPQRYEEFWSTISSSNHNFNLDTFDGIMDKIHDLEKHLSEINALDEIPKIKLIEMESTIESTLLQISTVKDELNKNRALQPQISAKIYRNEHPHFLHYFQPDRLGKIEKLKSSLHELELTEIELANRLRSLSKDLEYQTKALTILQENDSFVDKILNEIKDLRNKLRSMETLASDFIIGTAQQGEELSIEERKKTNTRKKNIAITNTNNNNSRNNTSNNTTQYYTSEFMQNL
jgi:hypothetical protein